MLVLLIGGLSSAEIASRLLVARIFTKLGPRDWARAVTYGGETGLVTPGGNVGGLA